MTVLKKYHKFLPCKRIPQKSAFLTDEDDQPFRKSRSGVLWEESITYLDYLLQTSIRLNYRRIYDRFPLVLVLTQNMSPMRARCVAASAAPGSQKEGNFGGVLGG